MEGVFDKYLAENRFLSNAEKCKTDEDRIKFCKAYLKHKGIDIAATNIEHEKIVWPDRSAESYREHLQQGILINDMIKDMRNQKVVQDVLVKAIEATTVIDDHNSSDQKRAFRIEHSLKSMSRAIADELLNKGYVDIKTEKNMATDETRIKATVWVAKQ